MKKKLVRVGRKDFDRLADYTWMEPQTVAIVRDVLVHGKDGAEVARSHGVSRQLVSRAVASIRRSYEEQRLSMPDAWLQIEDPLPAAVVEALEGLLQCLPEHGVANGPEAEALATKLREMSGHAK